MLATIKWAIFITLAIGLAPIWIPMILILGLLAIPMILIGIAAMFILFLIILFKEVK